jgi:peroxiredoxin (alkyl hydroperoxide reductase subunit C)
MTEPSTGGGLQLGQPVPSFELATYDPVRNDFGTISLEDVKSGGRWTILVFYPADFTFV